MKKDFDGENNFELIIRKKIVNVWPCTCLAHVLQDICKTYEIYKYDEDICIYGG